jgi:Fic family protein
VKSFIDLDRTFAGQPRQIAVLLATIDAGRGREDLFKSQRPQVLEQLSHDARIESITASNAIEGINVAEERARALAEGRVTFRNRTEKEFAGYRDALDELIRKPTEPASTGLILHLHRRLLQHSGGRGGYLKTEPNQIVSSQSGKVDVIFSPPPPEESEFLLAELFERYSEAQRDEAAHPILLIAAMALDLLSIHPFADGNGRTTRLITNSELMHRGYGVVRYVSLEQRTFDSRNSYYSSLYKSQQRWVETDGAHDLWPWATYFVTVLAQASSDFEELAAASSSLDGLTRQQQVERWVLDQAPEEFSRADVEAALSWISTGTINAVLARLRDEGKLTSTRGRAAKWRRM